MPSDTTGGGIQFLTKNAALESNLLRCARNYDMVAFATAWASADTRIFRELTSGGIKIQQAVVGTHFFQTHPDVLDAFIGSTRVRFALQPSGGIPSQGVPVLE